MVSSSQIRESLAGFLAGRIGFDAFEDWLVQKTWNIHLGGSSAAEALAFEIEESLSEYSSGHLAEEELRAELSSLIHRDNNNVVFADAPHASWEMLTSSQAVFVPSVQL